MNYKRQTFLVNMLAARRLAIELGKISDRTVPFMARQSCPLHRLAVIITLVAHNPSRVSRILDSRYNFFASPEIREETSIRTLCPNLCSPSTECILQCTVVRYLCMKLTWKKPVATCSQDRLRRPQNLSMYLGLAPPSPRGYTDRVSM